MPVSEQALRSHRAAIQRGPDGPFVWGAFEELLVPRRDPADPRNPVIDRLLRELSAIQNRLTDLRTCALKLDWMRDLRDQAVLDPMSWMLFASSDVTSFLANLRALFDHLARALRAAAPEPGGIPHQSFNDLRKWVARSDINQARQLGVWARDLVREADWFDEVRMLRDELLHYDAKAIVFPTERGISLQVYKQTRVLIAERLLLGTNGLPSFERVASAALSQTHVMLEEAAGGIAEALQVDDRGSGQSVHPGLGTIARWTDDLLTDLR